MRGNRPRRRPAPLQVPFRQFKLPNGLTVILHQDKTVPVATVNIWYHVGSANEKPGRTGFAHLFEHLMFEGSKHVKEGQFDTLLESAGANNNASTSNDRTNYYIDVPVNALDLALFLDSDRMGFLLDAMPPEQVNSQRDVVKNERRQSYENRPYGMASLELDKMLWPTNHPYNWPVIGYMEDLTAATQADVVEFFKKYYVPANASLVVAGDIDYDKTRAMVEKWFSDVPAGTAVERVKAPAASLDTVKRATLTDQVSLPRLYLAWITPALYAPGDAALDVVSQVLDRRQELALVQTTGLRHADCPGRLGVPGFGSTRQLVPDHRHRPARSHRRRNAEGDRRRAREAARPRRLTRREVQRALNQVEAAFYRRMERVSSKADQLNAYFFAGKPPDWFAQDLARYTSLTAADTQAALVRWLPADRRVELIVQPEGKQ